MANEIDTKLKVTVEGAVEGAEALDQLNQRLEETAEANDQAAESSGGFEESLSSAIGGVNAAIEVGQKFYQGLKAVSEEYNRQAGIIRNFHGSIEESSQRINGLVSNLQLMQASSRLAATGLQLADHDLANIAVAAQRYSSRTGADLNQSFDQLTEALNSGSSEALHRFGIETGGATDKVEGQRNAINSLNQQYGTLNAEATGVAGTMTQLKTAMDNAVTSFIATIDQSKTLQEETSGLSTEFDGLMRDLGIVTDDMDLAEAVAHGFEVGLGTLLDITTQVTRALRQMVSGDILGGLRNLSATLNIVNYAQTATRVANRAVLNDAVNDGVEAIERAQEALRGTVVSATPGARSGGGGGSRAPTVTAPNGPSDGVSVREETEASRLESERYNRMLAEIEAQRQLVALSNERIEAARALGIEQERQINEAGRAAMIEAQQLEQERAAAEEQRTRGALQQVAQDAFATGSQTLFQGQLDRTAKLKDLQSQYNQAVADGDEKKAAAAKAEMKSVGTVGKALKDSLKVWLKNFAIQTTFKGLAAGAEAIGLAFTNPPAAGGKAIESAELLAVAAAAGGASKAISSGGGKGGGATPESKPSGKSSEDSGTSAGNITINVQGQAYVTQAQIGGAIKDALSAHTNRYGTI